MPRELKIGLVVLLPILGIVVGIMRGEMHGARSERFVFDISGYDPRDLLHGHYLQYRVDLHVHEAESVCAEADAGCCLCLQPTADGAPPAVTRVPCEAARIACAAAMPTENLARLTRFYISEARADELTNKLREAAAHNAAKIVVAIDRAGDPLVESMLLDGVPVNAE